MSPAAIRWEPARDFINLNGGTLRLAGSATAPNLQQVVPASGYNQDLVWSNAESTLSYTAATTVRKLPVGIGMSVALLALKACRPIPELLRAHSRARPTPASNSSLHPMAPWRPATIMGSCSPPGANGTLTLDTPGQFQTLQLLTNTQGAGLPARHGTSRSTFPTDRTLSSPTSMIRIGPRQPATMPCSIRGSTTGACMPERSISANMISRSRRPIKPSPHLSDVQHGEFLGQRACRLRDERRRNE